MRIKCEMCDGRGWRDIPLPQRRQHRSDAEYLDMAMALTDWMERDRLSQSDVARLRWGVDGNGYARSRDRVSQYCKARSYPSAKTIAVWQAHGLRL